MSAKPLAWFQFDLDRKSGLGHLRRCEALGVELANRGWENRCRRYSRDGGEGDYHKTVKIDPRFPFGGHEVDRIPQLVVMDSYYMEHGFQASGGQRPPLVCFCDEPQKDPADLVVDMNSGADAAAYALAGAKGKVLAGPGFFPVRPGLAGLAAAARQRDRLAPAGRLLVTFGGTGVHALTARALREVAAEKLDLEIRVVAGDLAGRSAELQEAVGACPRASLAPPGGEIGEQFAWADLVLSAGGVTKYELAFFGAPAIIVAVVEHQAGLSERFARGGAARYLGAAEALPAGAIGRAVAELAADGAARARMSEAGRRLVDGRGAARIADEIEKLVEGRP